MYGKKHVLIPIDFSTASLEVIAAARNLSFPDVQITLFHVYNPIQLHGPTTREIAPPYTSLSKEAEKNLLNNLNQIRESKLSDFEEVRLCVEVSRYPAKAICQFAEREFVDLIIINAHGNAAVSRVVLGSVAEAVVRKAPCAVLVTRKGKYQADYNLGNKSYSSEKQNLDVPLYQSHWQSRSDCTEDMEK
jgi:nucleotide-binding universal stress UspA family protein